MTVTDEQRQLAATAAAARESRHTQRGDDRSWTPNRKSGEEIHRIGILGEFAFYNAFGGDPVDLGFRPGGDDGRDTRICGFPVDIKTSTYTGPNQYLRVPVDRMHPDTIYVAGVYDERNDDVHLIRWEWGHHLVRDSQVKCFPPHETPNYVKLYQHCRRMAELHTALTPFDQLSTSLDKL